MASAAQRALRWLLPTRAFDAVRAGTKEWLVECPCGRKQDAWEAGGIRYKAAGEPRRLACCPACGKTTMHRVRKKTEEERAEIP